MFPITTIAKLLIQLATITPAVNVSIEQIRQLVETIRKPGAGTQNQLDDLKKALELQAAVNKEINDKLKLIETVLHTVQKSLKILAVIGSGRRINRTRSVGRCGGEVSEEKRARNSQKGILGQIVV